jgi:outer membrane receptor protein involved in Fe transport
VFHAEVSLRGFSGFASGIDRCFGPGTQGGPCDNIDLTFEEDGETHRVSLAYDVDDDRMVYLTYSTGYRPGGVNRDDRFPPFSSDTIANYEAGFKTQWMDRRIRFNGALFFQEWDDLQFGLSPPGFQGVTFTFNAGGAEVRGVELDFSGSFGNLTLSGTGSYIDSELTQEFCNDQPSGPPLCTPPGTDLPIQPRFKGAATARYDFMLGSWEAFAQGTVLHQSSVRPYLLDEDFAAVGGRRIDGFTTLDLSTGARINNADLEFFVQNAFDERGVLTLNTACATVYCGPFARSYPIRPRIFGVRLSQRF